MPNTRKKVIKTVYKDDDASDADEGDDFSDSGSEAKISDHSESSEDIEEDAASSAEEFKEEISSPEKSKKAPKFKSARKIPVVTKTKFAKAFLNKIAKQVSVKSDYDNNEEEVPQFSIKDLTAADKLLPSVLNLSESDSSDDEEPRTRNLEPTASTSYMSVEQPESETEASTAYNDVWSKNDPASTEATEETADQSFKQFQHHTNKFEETKASIAKYTRKKESKKRESNVNDLLALGEEDVSTMNVTSHTHDDSSESEVEDWEEVKESKALPPQGIQLIVDFPGAETRKSKKVDVEMMMKRKINRVKKEYQVYMHKVHVLCWIGHGNYASSVLNDQEIMACALSMVPSQQCYPGERVDIKYLEQITKWYSDKIEVNLDKNENKFKPNAPSLKKLLLKQMKSEVVSSKKFLVFIFVSMLRALGIQCRLMLNFVTLPLKPPSTELCSLSTNPSKKLESQSTQAKTPGNAKKSVRRKRPAQKVDQLDGTSDKLFELLCEYDNSCGSVEDIMQLDGNDDKIINTPKKKTVPRTKSGTSTNTNCEEKLVSAKIADGPSPPKRARRSTRKPGVANQSNNLGANNYSSTEIQDITPLKKKKTAPVRKADVVKSTNSLKADSSSKSKKPVTSKKSSQELVLEEINADRPKSPVISKSKRDSKKPVKTVNSKINAEEIDVKKINKGRAKSPSISQPEKDTNTPVKTVIYKTNSKETVSNEINVVRPKSPVASRPKKVTKRLGNLQYSPASKEVLVKQKNILSSDTNSNVISKVTSNFFDKKLTIPTILLNNNPLSPEKVKKLSLSRKRSRTSSPGKSLNIEKPSVVKSLSTDTSKTKTRTRSAPGKSVETSEYFKATASKVSKKTLKEEDNQRVSHRELKVKDSKTPKKIDVTKDLVKLIKGKIKESKVESKLKLVKGKIKQESEGDSDYLPEENLKPKRRNSDSGSDFKPSKISPKSRVRKLDRRVISSDEESVKRKTGIDIWCEVFVEEEEQWVAVDVVKAQVHCVNEIYGRATHPVAYVVGWDNNNYLKDLTRRYVPHWNTVTRKLRAEAPWWRTAIQPWLGPSTPRDREEDEQLDRLQLDAPLPKIISEYKNHPLYALKRHLLKFEALYPSDAPALGFVRGEAVYARECVYTCRSRDTWLKEAKVVRLGEKPYKVVKARPKWDKLSNKLITDKPLEVFGPWQIQDYEPPTAENGQVPRNAYGNVELFKETMLPKGTVHIKLPGLNKVARKLNIDCAPAMTGFDFHGGWTHPVFDGFVVCTEFEEVLTEAWATDQEEMERKEQEKLELRVFGNWKRLIKGLMIRERLKEKYAFEDLKPAPKKKPRGPRFVTKK